jgi:Flp pilus assembly pilin Flp
VWSAAPEALTKRDTARCNEYRNQIAQATVAQLSWYRGSAKRRPTRQLLEERIGMRKLSQRLWQDERGQDLVEYGLALVLIAMAAVSMMRRLASAISNVFSNAASSLSTS